MNGVQERAPRHSPGVLENPPARVLPGVPVGCDACGAQIRLAKTLAGPRGRGGKIMPLDPVEDPAGNTAVLPGHHGVLYARVLGKDQGVWEVPDRPTEYLAMPHFATCPSWRQTKVA